MNCVVTMLKMAEDGNVDYGTQVTSHERQTNEQIEAVAHITAPGLETLALSSLHSKHLLFFLLSLCLLVRGVCKLPARLASGRRLLLLMNRYDALRDNRAANAL